MQFTSQRDSDLFLAISLSIFTFCFMFLGLKMHKFYFMVGFGCLIFAVVYWIRVKKGLIPKKVRLQEKL